MEAALSLLRYPVAQVKQTVPSNEQVAHSPELPATLN